MLSAIAERADSASGTGLSEAEIDGVEKALGRLPLGYRALLGRFGWISVGPFDIYGVGEALPEYLNVLTVAKDEWAQGGLPPNLIPLRNDGGGNLYCVGIQGDDIREEVFFWEHATRRSYAVARDLEEWLVEMIASIDSRD